MKHHNSLIKTICAAVVCLGLASCNSDLSQIFVSPQDDITLGGASADIVLSAENPQALALTLYWSGDGRLQLSDTLVQAPVNAAVETIQLSADADFTSPLDVSVDKGVRMRQFLSGELNGLLGRLGFEADVKSPLYIRISSALAANMAPTYSQVLKVMVQTYRIHLNLANVLDKDGLPTTTNLASPTENGIYQGFMGVNGWTNWWLKEANNTVWGNVGQDGKTFQASSSDDHWNFWFPSPGGCYYVTVNTPEAWWSALHVDNLEVAGDVSGQMTYNQKTNQWTMPINLTKATTATITIAGDAQLYNRETTDMGPAISQRIAFGGESSNLTVGTSPQRITLNLPAGETNLVLDLSNPLALTIEAGEPAPEEGPEQHVYLSGLVNWDGFDDYLSLYDESSLAYAGAHYINSEWGYRLYTQPDWAAAYKAADGSTALAGQLVAATTDGNIPAPESGLYLMDVSIKNLSYELNKINSVTFAGLNDDWTEQTMVQSATNPEVFTAEFVKTKESPWGVKVLINHDWSLFFTGSDGTLRLAHDSNTAGFTGDNSLTVGETYVLTIDLGKQTYSYTLK